jgi:hypothetical protein
MARDRSRRNVVVQLRPSKKKSSSKPAAAKAREVTRLGGALRALGGLGGTALGSLVGMGTTGGNFGTGIGAALSKWLGSGDYTVSANSITKRASAGQIPSMHKEGQSIVVRHKEFLTEIRGAQNFTIRNEFDLNPGLTTTFPWLSGIAAQYSQYKIKGLVYHYVPTSGNAVSSTNAALGTVMLQTSYRATEDAPTSKIEMLNEYWSSEAKPSEEFCHPIECDPKENPFNIQYIRSGNLPVTENQLMYDLGKTTVAVSGQQADDIVLGDLWVTYEIELKKPVLTGLNNTSLQVYGGTSDTLVGSGNAFGDPGSWVEKFNTFPCTITPSSNTVTFGRGLVGTFVLLAYYDGCTAFSSAVFTATNATLLEVIGPVASVGSDYTAGSGMAIASVYFTVSDPDKSVVLTLSASTINNSPRCRVLITEVNPLAGSTI